MIPESKKEGKKSEFFFFFKFYSKKGKSMTKFVSSIKIMMMMTSKMGLPEDDDP